MSHSNQKQSFKHRRATLSARTPPEFPSLVESLYHVREVSLFLNIRSLRWGVPMFLRWVGDLSYLGVGGECFFLNECGEAFIFNYGHILQGLMVCRRSGKHGYPENLNARLKVIKI